MKYWKGTDIQHIKYEEGCRILPCGKPASIVTSETMRIETEIVPNTAQIRKYVDADTFNMVEGLCVDIEIRKSYNNGKGVDSVIFVPLEAMGYEKEPAAHSDFDYAMEIV